MHHIAYRDVVERQFGGWDDSQQDAYFESTWPQHDHEIVEWDGEPCGYVAVEFGATRVELHELVLDPAYQNRGIGTTIVIDTVTRARQIGLPSFLQVLRENRAARLYERFGFEEYEQTPTHRRMRLLR